MSHVPSPALPVLTAAELLTCTAPSWAAAGAAAARKLRGAGTHGSSARGPLGDQRPPRPSAGGRRAGVRRAADAARRRCAVDAGRSRRGRRPVPDLHHVAGPRCRQERVVLLAARGGIPQPGIPLALRQREPRGVRPGRERGHRRQRLRDPAAARGTPSRHLSPGSRDDVGRHVARSAQRRARRPRRPARHGPGRTARGRVRERRRLARTHRRDGSRFSRSSCRRRIGRARRHAGSGRLPARHRAHGLAGARARLRPAGRSPPTGRGGAGRAFRSRSAGARWRG